MPDFDDPRFDRPRFDGQDSQDRQLRRLRELAVAAGRRAHGLPPEEVRAIGARRHRRRTLATVVAASVAVVACAGGALAAAGRLDAASAPPQPVAPRHPRVVPVHPTPTPSPPSSAPSNRQTGEPSPTPRTPRLAPAEPQTSGPRVHTTRPPSEQHRPPRPAATQQSDNAPSSTPRLEPTLEPMPMLPRSVLLRADQTAYFERGDFRVTSTAHGDGEGYVSVCQRAPLSSLGTVDIWRRDFSLPDGGPVVRSAALQFADDSAARAAYDTLRTWADSCRQAVRSHGFDRFSDRGQWYGVQSAHGSARFRSGMTYGPVPSDPHGEMAYFGDQGLVVAGDRVMLVTLVVPGQDSNWAYTEQGAEQTGLSMHPMFTMLAQAAGNLR